MSEKRQAACAILDRGIGRPMQTVEKTVTHQVEFERLTDEELMRFLVAQRPPAEPLTAASEGSKPADVPLLPPPDPDRTLN